jgi:hypothetical protein
VQGPRFEVRLGLRALALTFHHEAAMVANPEGKVVFAASQGIARRAEVLGFENGFVLAGIILLAAVPLCLLLQPAAHHLKEEEKAEGAVEAEFVAE